MLAGKLSFGVEGDYPLIVNGAKFHESNSGESRFIALTGYKLKGTGNGIVVPVASDVFSLEQLTGKVISTPVGSAAWGMMLKALRDKNMLDKVEIKNQAPPVGVANIAQNKIDAHADFCPWSEVMEFRGTGRKVFDGSEAGIFTFEASIKPQWVEALKYNHALLVGETKLAPLDFDRWVDESFVKAAFKAKGLDYEAAKGSVVASKPDNPDLPPAEVRIDGEGVKTFDSVKAMSEAVRAAQKGGKTVPATYVYDKATGLKLFGKVAFFVQAKEGGLVPFMKKGDAESFAASSGGTLVDWKQIVS
jgi:hypothetical protein